MCELAKIDAVWAVCRTADDNHRAQDAVAALTAVAEVTSQLGLGLAIDDALRASEEVQHVVDGLATAAAAGRLQVALESGAATEEVMQRWRERIRLGLRLENAAAAGDGRIARLADDVVLSAAALGGPPRAGKVIEAARAACQATGRDPDTLGIALEVPVSLGRTTAEAFARAAAEPLFDDTRVGQPAEVGLFGTLEDCQARVVELAHAGVTELRCSLPNAPDLPDVIAQLTAMVVGRLDILSPSAPRSRDPDPPAEWGGRSRFPRQQR
jgi:alkanesulfonate monooxygenase SsuD/methylene tetrahydromethanopterin reductase-like flavin-dependent oxidoreductase (luciferase family)